MMRNERGWNDIGVYSNDIINVGLLEFELVMQINDFFMLFIVSS
jgi:hypothetical protein